MWEFLISPKVCSSFHRILDRYLQRMGILSGKQLLSFLASLSESTNALGGIAVLLTLRGP